MITRPELKFEILKTGVPQYRLAVDLHKHPSWLSNIVRGAYEPDGLEKELIAERLRVPVEKIFPEKEAAV